MGILQSNYGHGGRSTSRSWRGPRKGSRPRPRTWPRSWQGGEGLDPGHQTRPTRQGRQDQVPGGDLPLLPPHQGARDHRQLHRPRPEGRGPEDHAGPEADQGRTEDQVQGVRRYWRLQRPRGTGSQVQQGVATAIRGAIILAKLSIIPVRRGFWGNKIGKPHTVPCKVTGKCGSIWVRLIPAPRGTGIVSAPIPKKLLQMAGIEDCYTSAKGSTGTLGNFAKATYAAITKTYSYLTPDLWKETVFQKSPYQEFTDFLAKNHRAAGVQKQEARAY